MKKYIKISLVLVGFLLLLSGCGDSTSLTVFGEYKDVPKDLRENLLEHAKNFDREDYYGTWYHYKEFGIDSVEVTIKIDDKYFEDVYSGKKVKYKFNRKTHELVLETKEAAELSGITAIDGHMVFTFMNGKDKNRLTEMGYLVEEDGERIPHLGAEYIKISPTEEDSMSSESEDIDEDSVDEDIKESIDESSAIEVSTLTKSDIFEIQNSSETYQFISLNRPEAQAIEAALKKNGFSVDDIDNKRYSTFTDKDRNVVVAGIYSNDEQLEKIMMIDLDSHEIKDVNVPSSTTKDSTTTTDSSKSFDPDVAEPNPMLGGWITTDNTKTFQIEAEGSSLTVGSSKYDLIMPKITGNKVEYSSNFNIGSSAMIHKVELEWVQDNKAKARFYLEDDRVITEDLVKQ